MSNYSPYGDSGATPDTSAIAPIGGMQIQQAQTLMALRQQHAWMPMQTATALASSNIDPQTAVGVGEQMRQIAKSGVDKIQTIRDDPVLEKAPSNLMIFNQYVNHAVGPLPIEQQHLVDVQKTIQAQGFGQDLPADGVFSPEWNAAFQQSYSKAVQDQLAGAHRPASTTSGGALKWLRNTLPKEAANAVIGYVTHLPGEIRHLGADLVGGTAAGLQSIGEVAYNASAMPFRSGYQNDVAWAAAQNRIHNTAATAGGFVEGKTPEQYTAELSANPGGRLVADVGNFINLWTMGSAGAGLAAKAGVGAGTNAAAGTATETAAQQAGEKVAPNILGKARMLVDPATPLSDVGLTGAARSPGVVANTVGRFVGTTTGRVTLGSAAGVAYGAYRGDTGSQLLRDGAIGGGAAYLGSYAYNNIPILSKTGSAIASAFGDNGAYYRMRSLIALPYEYAPVQAAGQAVGALGTTGLALHAEAGLSPGAGTSFTQSIQDSHVIDPLNDAVKHKLTFQVGGQTIKPDLDWLAFALHAPMHGDGAMSSVLSNKASDIHASEKEALGNTSIITEIERATGQRWKDLETTAGSSADADSWAKNKAVSMAAAAHAQEQLHQYEQENGRVFDALDRVKFLENAASDARRDPEIINQQLAKFESSPGTLTNMIRNEIKTQHSLSDAPDVSDGEVSQYLKRDLGDYMQAVHVARDHLVPNQDMLLGPHLGITASDDAEAAARQVTGQDALVAPPGRMLGLAKDSYLTNDVAQRDVASFRDRLSAAGAPGADANEYDKVVHDLHTYFYKEFHVDPTQLAEPDPEAQLDILDRYAQHQAAPAVAATSASPRVTQALQDLKDLGYKPVYGTDIGHILLDDPMVDLGKSQRWLKRAVGNMGMNIERFHNGTIAQYRNTSIRSGVQDLLDNGGVSTNAPYWDANSIVRDIHAMDPNPNLPQRVAGAVLQRDSNVNSLAQAIRDAADTEMSSSESIRRAKQQLEREAMGVYQLRDYSHSQVIDHLTRPLAEASPGSIDEIKRAAAAGDETAKALVESGDLEKLPLMDEESAQKVFRRIVTSSADMPGYMVGAEKLQDLFRAGGPMGFVGEKIGGNVGYAVANVPNELLKLRNQWRFALSPAFSFRRVLKTNLKLALEDVSPTFTPLHDMMAKSEAFPNGTLDDDIATLNRVMPALANKDYDDGVRYLASNDVYGIYNHRNFEARAAGIWERQGKTDDEIRQLFTRTLGYGSYGGDEGRTAAERTANFFFFPFSFDKTLYRNVGAHMLDHPAQMLTLNNALSTYNAYDKDHELTQRLEAQMPILNEALRLNAFAHGVSLGEPGGINAPLLNMFMPQSWATSSKSKNTLERFVPVLKDALRVMDEMRQQYNIVFTGGSNITRELSGDISLSSPIQNTGSDQSQRQAAGAYRRELYDKYADVLDYNSGFRDQKNDPGLQRVPNDSKQFGAFANKPITKGLLQEIVAAKYPAYNTASGAEHVDKLNKELTHYSLYVTGPYAPQIQDFIATAQTAANALNSDSYTSDQAAAYTDAIRHNAIWLAERDPSFYKAYNKYFQYDFGPIESLNYG